MGKKAGLAPEDVVSVAARLADEHGFYNVTLARLADELGIRSPSLYTYVEGIDGLRRTLKLHANELLGQRLVASRDGCVGEDALVEMCVTFRVFSKERPGLYQAVMMGVPQPGDEQMMAAALTTAAPVIEVLGEMGIADDMIFEALRLYRAAIHGFLALEREGGFGWDLDVDNSYRLLIEVLLNGLRTTIGSKH